MATQIIEITEVHPDDTYYKNINTIKDRVGDIMVCDSNDIHPNIQNKGFNFINACYKSNDPKEMLDCFYAVKYKVLFGVRD